MQHAIASMITAMSRYTWVLGSAWSLRRICHHSKFSHFYSMRNRIPYIMLWIIDRNQWCCLWRQWIETVVTLGSVDVLLGSCCSEAMLLVSDVARKRKLGRWNARKHSVCTGSGQGLIDIMQMIVNVLHCGMKDLPGDQIRALPVLTSGWPGKDPFMPHQLRNQCWVLMVGLLRER